MKASIFGASLLLLATNTCAQTPANFGIISTLPLDVELQSSNTTVTPGLLVPQSDTRSAPTLRVQPASDSDQYVVLMIDSAVPVLHWLQAGLVVASDDQTLQVNSNVDSTIVGTPYIGPMPPAGSGPHNYVILLFEQPSNWTIPANYSSINPPMAEEDVVGFDVVDFVAASKLGAVVGSNYFRVLNGTLAETSSFATATKTGDGAPASATAGMTSSSTAASTATSTGASVSATATSGAVLLPLSRGVLSVGFGFLLVAKRWF